MNSPIRTQSQRLRFVSVMAQLAIALLALGQSGCQVFQRFQQPASPPPVAFDQTPTLDALLQSIARQSAAVKQVKAEVRVAMDGVPGRLKGTLTVERPKKLRLKAGLAGISELGVDVGSNDQVFWIWSRANIAGQTPVLMYADHLQYQHSQLRHQIPLEPTWLIDALGFLEFTPSDQHRGPFPRSDGRLEIHTTHQMGAERSTRVTVIDPKYGWILQQAIYDQNGRLLAYVNSLKHRYYAEYNVSLPQSIELQVFQPDGQTVKLSVQADEYSLNAIYGDPSRLWAMPNPPGIPQVDLTQVSNGPLTSQSSGYSQPGFQLPTKGGWNP